MFTERQRWNILNKLDMGYSLDSAEKESEVIEDIIINDDVFYKASKGLCNRTQYMEKKLELEMFFATMQEPPKELINLLLQVKQNVQAYLLLQKI